MEKFVSRKKAVDASEVSTMLPLPDATRAFNTNLLEHDLDNHKDPNGVAKKFCGHIDECLVKWNDRMHKIFAG